MKTQKKHGPFTYDEVMRNKIEYAKAQTEQRDTAQHSAQTSIKWAQRCGELQGRIESLEGERDQYKAHAERLAEALKELLSRSKGLDQSATVAGLANCDALAKARARLAQWEANQ